MKNIQMVIATVIGVLIIHSTSAQPKQKINIEQATIFLHGAELTSSAKVNIPQGESEVIFTNIAGSVNQPSINVVSDKDIVVQSTIFQSSTSTDDNMSPMAKALQDSINRIKEEIALTGNHVTSIDAQLNVLDKHNDENDEKTTKMSIADIQHLMDIIDKKMEKLLDEKHRLEAKIAKCNSAIARIQDELNKELQKNYQPGGQLLVKFYAKEAVSSNIIISYVVPNAGWNPSYDLRVEQAGDPIQLFYKANVFQNSGVKWDKVRVVLSTGNPNENAEAPELKPWHLAFYNPQPAVTAYRTPLVRQENSSAAMMSIDAAPNGYISEKKLKAGHASGNQYIVDGVAVETKPTTIDQYVITDNSGINSTFDIDIPYSIPSDGQQHVVSVKTYQLPATYRYYAVPKLDKDAFLQAQVTNWENMNLLPAKTSIFFEGTYVGQGELKLQQINDTMTLSLGRDKKVMIKREIDNELKSRKVLNNNAKETVAYAINIRNTHKKPIDVVILDQMPVSHDNDIIVEDQVREGASYNESTGEVKWALHMDANESKKLLLGYTVKYPKQKVVSNL